MQESKGLFSKRNLIFMGVFVVLGLIALQINVNHLAGSKASLTLFEMIGPLATAFIGTIPGVIAVAIMEIVNFLIHGAKTLDAGTIIHFFPMLVGAWYFGAKGKFNWIIPVIAIAAFLLNPIGRSAWEYSLYWLIPIVAYFFREKSLIIRTLGATFASHAVGGAVWVWVFGLTKAIWIGLIPVVAIERSMFAIGMAVSYLLVNNILNVLVNKKIVPFSGLVNKQYVWKWADNL